MSNVKRDFSEAYIEEIRGIIKTEVENSSQYRFFDMVQDWIWDDFDICDYIDDVKTYQKRMIDKHDISNGQFDKILKRVHSTDINYGKRFDAIASKNKAFNDKLKGMIGLMDVNSLTLKNKSYLKYASKVNDMYDKYANDADKLLENAIAEYDIEDIDYKQWYEELVTDAMTAMQSTNGITGSSTYSLLKTMSNMDLIKALKKWQISGTYFSYNVMTDKFKFYSEGFRGQWNKILKNEMGVSVDSWILKGAKNGGYSFFEGANGVNTKKFGKLNNYFANLDDNNLKNVFSTYKGITGNRFSRTVKTFGSNAKSTFVDGLKIWDDFDIKGIDKYTDMSKGAKVVGKAGKCLGIVGDVMMVGSDITDNFYDKEEDKWSFSGGKLAGTITDIGVDIGVGAGSAAIGAGIGTCIGGPVGTAVGFAAGCAVDYAINTPIPGTDKSTVDWVKTGAKIGVDKAGDAAEDALDYVKGIFG